MFGSTLQRMIFGQLVRVFLFTLFGLTGLFLLGGVVQEASQRGLTPPQIIQVMPFLIPSTLPYTVPATVLFACCVVYGRMSHDHEITALRAVGVHLGRLLAPAVVLSLVVAGGLAYLQFDLIPRSRQMLANRVLADIDELVYSMLKRTGCIRHQNLSFAVFVREIRGKQLLDAVFKRRNEKGGYSVVAHAKEAKLWTDLGQDKVFIFMPNCTAVGEADGNLRDQTFEVSFPASTFKDTQVRPMNMTHDQIEEKLHELEVDQAEHRKQLDVVEAQLATAGHMAPDTIVKLRLFHQFRIQEAEKVKRLLRAEVHMRPALAIGAIAFAVIAFPVGVWFHRADHLSTFVSCFLPVVLIYYPLLLAGTNFAREGRMSAAVSVWIADGVSLVVGAIMLRRLFRQ